MEFLKYAGHQKSIGIFGFYCWQRNFRNRSFSFWIFDILSYDKLEQLCMAKIAHQRCFAQKLTFCRRTGDTRGFAFVRFYNRDDAEDALDDVDGR